MTTPVFAKNRLAVAISLISLPLGLSATPAFAQEEEAAPAHGRLEEMMVTSARREQTVQDIPINISAVGSQQIEDLRLGNIADISRYVPGLTVIDRGPRNSSADIFVRGLNTTGLGPGFVSDTVAIYMGDIPVDINLKPNDMERVEVLIGPQGTLYGQGTMGGAIRYIPKVADTEQFSGEVRGDVNSTAESDGVGHEIGFTLNVPLIKDTLAFRASADQLNDPGFIDYSYVVRDPGVSNPEPDFSNPDDVAANLRQVKDANGERTVSGRANLRWTPTDMWDVNLWYYYQDTKAEGRQINNELSFYTDRYESGLRYEEPNHYTNDLISLDVEADFGFAVGTLVYGKTNYEEVSQRDQTDLLLGFEYGYEAFPSFSAYTREDDDHKSETKELRLVSQYESPFQWVIGYFDYTFEQSAVSQEFTPGFDQFAIDNFGGVALRPDSLEYIQLTEVDETETAFYGELSYDITSSLTATVGYRNYKYSVNNAGGFGLPLYETVFLGEPDDAINVDIGENSGDDKGDLYKFNLAYDFDANNMMYATYSQGYRKGGVNAVPECTPEQIASDDQQLCAQPDEVLIDPDTIDNYEIGYKGVLLDGDLSLNAAVYFIDWKDLQISTTTDLGSLPITGNGSAAENKGIELSGNYYLTDNWMFSFTYAYTNAELTEDAPGLVGSSTALAGARLPGHAEHQGSLNVTYSKPLSIGVDMDINYGMVYFSDVYNIVGGPEDPLVDEDGLPTDFGGEAIPSFSVHHLSATFSRSDWRVQAYIDNLWDEFYVLGTRTTRRDSILQDRDEGPGTQYGDFTLRSYGQYVGRPRTIGVKLSYKF